MALDYGRKPWTMELIRAGLAIGTSSTCSTEPVQAGPSVLYLSRACAFIRTARPSSVSSGHSFLGNFLALLLLEIPQVASRFGIGMTVNGSPAATSRTGSPTRPTTWRLSMARCSGSPVAWPNAQRLGLHYPSDSSAGRHLAGGVWAAIFSSQIPAANRIWVPTLAGSSLTPAPSGSDARLDRDDAQAEVVVVRDQVDHRRAERAQGCPDAGSEFARSAAVDAARTK